MQKRIIANWGHAKQGKSQTIKRVAELILKKYPNAITNPRNFADTKDIKVIITIGKIKIGIESTGDPNSRLFKSLFQFVEAGCEIIICSTRTSGDTEKAVLELRESYKIIWVTNFRSDQFDFSKLNDISAKYIVELLNLIISDNLK